MPKASTYDTLSAMTADDYFLVTDDPAGTPLTRNVSKGRALNFPRQTLTDAASISWDLLTQHVGTVTLGGNRTLANPSNQVNGGQYELLIVQDGTGSRTLAFGTAYLFPGNPTPVLTTTAAAIDRLVCSSDGTNMICEITYNYS